MGELKENISTLSNTGSIENVLIAIAYWLAVIVVILFVFYVAVKINNWRLYSRKGKGEKDDYLL
ncbi:MAG: hypothetical protein K6E10_01725 [Eubacterium sp.]|nr:hypothetical protein [Eubacterium sp.]